METVRPSNCIPLMISLLAKPEVKNTIIRPFLASRVVVLFWFMGFLFFKIRVRLGGAK